MKFGSIVQFCLMYDEKVEVINICQYQNTGILDSIRSSRHTKLTKSACSKISDFVYCVRKTDEHVAIPVSSVFVKCVYIPLQEAQ